MHWTASVPLLDFIFTGPYIPFHYSHLSLFMHDTPASGVSAF